MAARVVPAWDPGKGAPATVRHMLFGQHGVTEERGRARELSAPALHTGPDPVLPRAPPPPQVPVNYDARNPFDICTITFTPVYRGSKYAEDK